MDLYDKMLNINNLDIEEEIKLTISDVKKELSELTTDQTCKIYSSMIYEKLKEKGILSKLIDTENFGNDFSHMFVIALDNNDKYLIDLTYEQFKEKEKLNDLLTNGYIKIDDETFKDYLEIVLKSKNSFSIDDALYQSKNRSF